MKDTGPKRAAAFTDQDNSKCPKMISLRKNNFENGRPNHITQNVFKLHSVTKTEMKEKVVPHLREPMSSNGIPRNQY
jgi:hypothetical protein